MQSIITRPRPRISFDVPFSRRRHRGTVITVMKMIAGTGCVITRCRATSLRHKHSFFSRTRDCHEPRLAKGFNAGEQCSFLFLWQASACTFEVSQSGGKYFDRSKNEIIVSRKLPKINLVHDEEIGRFY